MTGEQLKIEGIERVQEHNRLWTKKAVDWIRFLASTQPEFTTDDLKLIRWERGPNHPNAYGAAFNTAAKAGIIKRVGYRKSTSPSAHSRVVSVWTKA